MQYKQISRDERLIIDKLLELDYTKSKIAEILGRNESTIYRELNRNRVTENSVYLADAAHLVATARRRNSGGKPKIDSSMAEYIEDKLKDEQWSPEQIAERAKLEGRPMVSHETIYKHIYEDSRKGGDLYKELRRSRRKRQSRSGKYKRRGIIPDRVSIEQRPDEVEQRSRIGDWEADTIIGKGHKSQLLTITERKTSFTLIAKLVSRQADATAKVMNHRLGYYKQNVETITVDNGKEFAEHKRVSEKIAQVYFAHPYSSYERGSNENQNGLIRQYFPKGTDLNTLTNEQIRQVQNKLNNRPRKKLNFRTPKEVFEEHRKSLALQT